MAPALCWPLCPAWRVDCVISALMKIVRSGFGLGDRQGTNALRFDGDDILLILQTAFNEQKLLMDDGDVILLKQLRGDDGIGDSRLVFEAQAHVALSGSRTLTRNHRAGHANMGAVANAV